jgi:hypothetical protein
VNRETRLSVLARETESFVGTAGFLDRYQTAEVDDAPEAWSVSG